MKTRLYNFSEDTNEIFVFRWTRKHYEFCMDNDIFLNHRGKKVYKERNLLLFSKGDKIRIEADVIAEQYNVPCLYKVENDGSDEDIEAIKKVIA